MAHRNTACTPRSQIKSGPDSNEQRRQTLATRLAGWLVGQRSVGGEHGDKDGENGENTQKPLLRRT